jgi:hypothetical protein
MKQKWSVTLFRPPSVLSFNRFAKVKGDSHLIHDPMIFELLLRRWSSLDATLDEDNKAALKSSNCLQVVLKATVLLVVGNRLNKQVMVGRQLHRLLVHKIVEDFSFNVDNNSHCLHKEASTVLRIVANLLGFSPPDVSVMRDVVSLCLLLHDTGLTFVAHSKSNFYYDMTAAASGEASSGAASGASRPSVASGTCEAQDDEDSDDDGVLVDRPGEEVQQQFSPESLQRALLSIQKKRRQDKMAAAARASGGSGSFSSNDANSSTGSSGKRKPQAVIAAAAAAGTIPFSNVAAGILEDDTTEKEDSSADGEKNTVDDIDMSFLNPDHSILEHPGQWGEDLSSVASTSGGAGNRHHRTCDLLLEGLLFSLSGAVVCLAGTLYLKFEHYSNKLVKSKNLQIR